MMNGSSGTDLYEFTNSDLEILGDLDGVIPSSSDHGMAVSLLSQPLQQPFDPISLPPVVTNWQSDHEEVGQTGVSVDTIPFPGHLNFRIEVEDTGSKHYAFSSKLNRLFCSMDKAIPMKFLWNSQPFLHVRAMLLFKDPDYVNLPVFRCRTHNDENHANNRDCKHYKHILRCDNETTMYKENSVSKRHSVITLPAASDGMTGMSGRYRLMCLTTCCGVDAIARRKTEIVFTLEDSNHQVLGRAVIGVKICSCPIRDKNREEGDEGSKKKRKCDQDDTLKKILKKEPAFNESLNIKQENEYVDMKITVPSFPTVKIPEFHNILKRLVSSFYSTEDDISQKTRGVQVHIEQD